MNRTTIFENGKEAIDWIVLDVQDDEAFILSEKCLDARIFFGNMGDE